MHLTFGTRTESTHRLTHVFRRKVRDGDQIFCEWGTITEQNGTKIEKITRRVVHQNATYELQRQLRIEAREKRAEERRLAEEQRCKHDDDIQKRTEQLMGLEIGGIIATIERQYPNYTSRWVYYCTKDNLLIRRRPGDEATVPFHDYDEMLDDFHRYRWAQFELA